MSAERKELETLTVGDAMHRGLVSCDVHSPLGAVARMMAAHRIHCVVVRNGAADETPGAGLWGVVSDLDFVRILVEDGVVGRTAGESATTPAMVVSAYDPIARAAALMADRDVTHLVVVDHAKRPVGVVSTLDVARAVSDSIAATERKEVQR